MKFESETDTEVIPKLCRYVYNNLSEPLAFSEVQTTGALHIAVSSTRLHSCM